MSRLKQAERGPNERSNPDCHDTEKHQHNASTDRFGNVDRDGENDRLTGDCTNENSKRIPNSSSSGVQGNSVEQSGELVTNETQQKQPLKHKRLHNSTEIKTQVLQESVITGAASTRLRNENEEPEVVAKNPVVRDKPKNFHCSECGKQFRSNSKKVEHSRIHTGEKPYKCGQCGVAFRQKGHLTGHQRTHSEKKPFVCHICKQEFGFMTTLSNHMLIHPGEKPFNCNVCGKAFCRKATLSRHWNVHARVENSNEE